MKEKYDFVILGAGVAGLAAGMYGARLGLKTLILGASHGTEMPIGGVITTTDTVENYPGFIKLTGDELAENLRKHAESYDEVTIKEEKADNVEMKKNCFNIKTNKGEYEGKTVLFATGTKWKELKVPGHDEYRNKGVAYCALCQPPEEEIVANSNMLAIGNVTPLTKVLTMDGSHQRVGGFIRRKYKGDLIKIKPRFFTESVSLTPNHPVLSLRIHKGIGKDYWKDFKFSEIKWKEAGSLERGDCVLYPVIKKVEDKEYINMSNHLELRKEGRKIIPHKKTHTGKLLKDKIKITKEFMRLVGYFLSEGSASRHNLVFYFNKNEQDYIKDVSSLLEKTFGLKPKISYRDNVGIIGLYNKVIADLFKVLFDKYAHSKNVPHFIMLLPPEKQKEIIKGLWRGDGCVREKDFCLVTSSRKLAYQVRDILLRLGIIPSIMKREKEKLNRIGHKIEGRDVSFTKDKYHIVVGGQFLEKMCSVLDMDHPYAKKRKGLNRHSWLKDDYAVLPIRKIERVPYEGEVFSLGVEGNQSYVAKNFVVHNCDAALFKGKVVGLVGGSDSAAKDALVLSKHAKKVFIIYRGKEIHPEPINMDRIRATKNIEIINQTNVVEIKGGQFVEKVVLDKEYKGEKELELQGVFIAIGHLALSELAKNMGVKLNEKGEIMIDHKTSETNLKGVFGAGDVADKPFKQAITGVAEGCTAAYSAFEYITKNKVEAC
jgi:thioredoxin reductase/intein/homing endonuclease